MFQFIGVCNLTDHGSSPILRHTWDLADLDSTVLLCFTALLHMALPCLETTRLSRRSWERNSYSKARELNSTVLVLSVPMPNITEKILVIWGSNQRKSPSETFCDPPVSGNRIQDVRESPSPSSITSGYSFGIFLSGFFPKSLRNGLLKADLNIKQMRPCHKRNYFTIEITSLVDIYSKANLQKNWAVEKTVWKHIWTLWCLLEHYVLHT